MNKLLTVTIPVYNTEQYLKRCLDSLIIIPYLEVLEVLIVIDGSPDNSIIIANQYEKKFPRTFKVIEKENGGHGSSINKGIEMASGKYFRVLDSDDWFDSVEFEKYLEELHTLDVDMILGNYSKEYIHENRQDILVYEDIKYKTIYNSEDFDYTNFKGDKLIIIHRVTYSTMTLRKSKLILPDRYYTDVLYSLCVFPFVTSFVFSEPIVYHYLIGRNDQSVSKIGFRKSFIQHREMALSCAHFILSSRVQSISTKNKEIWIAESLIGKVGCHIKACAESLNFIYAIREISTYKKILRALSPSLYLEAMKQNKTNKLFHINTIIGLVGFRIYRFLQKFK